MTATGRGALALASLVADQSADDPPIEVRADSVVCLVGNVDITQHDCTLTFGNRSVREEGRRG